MLTRRGWTVAAVAVGAAAMAAGFGARSLNAVVGPSLVALAAGYVQVRRAPRPDLDAEAPAYGSAGEIATVSLSFDAPTPLAATVRLDAEEGLAVPDDSVETTVAGAGDGDALDFAVELRERGVRAVGPVEVVAEDVFGVWTTTHRYPIRREIVVFPGLRRLSDATALSAFGRASGPAGRERFDGLREYERGDPLRDVHWKASAARPDADLMVTEFDADERRERIELVAEADGDDGAVDETAEAAASVAAHLLDEGLAVGLTVPGDRIDPDAGPDHRTDLFGALARLSTGTVRESRRERADVVVRSDGDEAGVAVTVGDRTVPFRRMAGESADPGGGDRRARADGGRDGGERR